MKWNRAAALVAFAFAIAGCEPKQPSITEQSKQLQQIAKDEEQENYERALKHAWWKKMDKTTLDKIVAFVIETNKGGLITINEIGEFQDDNAILREWYKKLPPSDRLPGWNPDDPIPGVPGSFLERMEKEKAEAKNPKPPRPAMPDLGTIKWTYYFQISSNWTTRPNRREVLGEMLKQLDALEYEQGSAAKRAAKSK